MIRPMIRKTLAMLSATLMLSFTPAYALGPDIGAPAPTVSAVTSGGEPVDFAAITGEAGTVLVFSRSLSWCPYCKKQAIELVETSGAIAQAGWTLSLVTYDEPEVLAKFAAQNEINYALLSDTDSAMIDAFGLRNTDVTPGSRFDGIPHPAIVLIGSDGVVKSVLREEGYIDRPSTEAVMESIAAAS